MLGNVSRAQKLSPAQVKPTVPILQCVMKFIYSAIVASVAWYLMVPPINGGNIQYAAPLSQWKIAANYDSADACEAAKLRTEGEAPGPPGQNAAHADPRLLAGQCISSGDARFAR
jgi:hypothetical protein